MGDTPAFFVLTTASTTLITLAILANRSLQTSRTMARTFYRYCILLSAATLLLSILSPFHFFHGSFYNQLFHILIFRGWIIIGGAIAAAILLILNAAGRAWGRAASTVVRDLITSPHLLRGLCISVAVAFICTEIGKLTHDAEMREFFLQSGYPVWFLYFVITAETIGSIGLLIPRTMLLAAGCLSTLMMGAIGSHARNGDPFSDSLEALHLLILLGCIIVIHLLSDRVAPMDQTTVFTRVAKGER